MNRPGSIWLTFGACLAVALAAMGWVSLTALRLDHAEWRASQKAEQEERTRLALWRMDSFLAALILEESARPFNAYEAFSSAPRAYTKTLTQITPGEVLVPSPLLTFVSSNILLHFQLAPDGRVTSPQVPIGNQRDLAEAGYTTQGRLSTAAARLAEFEKLLGEAVSPEGWDNNRALLRAQVVRGSTSALELAQAPVPPQALAQSPSSRSQSLRSQVEQQARASLYDNAQQITVANNLNPGLDLPPAARPPAVGEALFRPVWLGQELVLARRVNLIGSETLQGCWLNWPTLRQSLLDTIRDLAPEVQLVPATSPENGADAHLLATIPVKAILGAAASEPIPRWTPVRLSLAIAWGCVLLAGLAVAGLLHGAISLSERRAAFVSAVTHELRTPLTTFKMYSEMLAADMVPDAEKRTRYLNTLCAEANRLQHLVENVLAYARLERGSARSRVERLTLAELFERVKPRLVEHAERAGLTLQTDGDVTLLRTAVEVDVSAVEQILFNLVDNACKYAAPSATEKVIHLEALPDGRFALLRVRDHGQGISAEGAKRLFQPFSKSAHEAAHTAPGVGLGLALCRRLSRDLGGELQLDRSVTDGACFLLRLPVSH
jgi:signal transduction histidine kinase